MKASDLEDALLVKHVQEAIVKSLNEVKENRGKDWTVTAGPTYTLYSLFKDSNFVSACSLLSKEEQRNLKADVFDIAETLLRATKIRLDQWLKAKGVQDE